MIAEGQIVLFRFPQTNQTNGKLRPALVIRQLPGQHNDWLICMISSQIHQQVPDFDEVVSSNDSDFLHSGLKSPSLIRISRLAVVEGGILLGKLGQIDIKRLSRIKQKLSLWIQGGA
jgi:mRNA interferase MazF